MMLRILLILGNKKFYYHQSGLQPWFRKVGILDQAMNTVKNRMILFIKKKCRSMMFMKMTAL